VSTVTQRRNFNQQTLANVHRYLAENFEKIKFERNESGFIRTTFPDHLFHPDHRVGALKQNERLRANYWFDDKSGMGDESIHDHPNPFQSYIVSGGYEHEIYRISFNESTKDFRLSMSLDREQLWLLYQKFVENAKVAADDPTTPTRKFKFSIDKVSKSVTYEGTVMLRLSGVEGTKQGDIVDIDSHMIHRVSMFQRIPGIKTLSLNIVRSEGKGKTNIYLPEKKTASVKVSRDIVSAEDSRLATKEMITLFAKASRDCTEEKDSQGIRFIK